MTILKIITHPAESLRKRSADVNPEIIGTPEFQDFCDVLIATMFEEDGIGLAAPQVGQNDRVIAVNQKSGSDVFINPEIIKSSEAKDEGEEGCLSVPGVWGVVERSKKVTVRALNRHNRIVEMDLKGFEAVIFQHEIDHLDGILFIDKASEITKGQEHLEGSKAL